MTTDEMPECPLCMVELFYDDLNFYPCSCGYQICRFCWSKILNEENGLCPACRRAYDSEAPASFTPLSEEQFQKLKREKRQKERKNKTIENRKHLADIRVVQRNLAFVIGLPLRFSEQAEVLKSNEYFGKYGKVFKVVVNRNAAQPGSQNPSTVGAYVTFVRGEDTIQAILDLNKQQMEGRTLKASLGTTKYCSQFLKGASCTKGECMYLHELGDEAASFTKEEMQQNKHTEYEKKLIEDFIEQNGLATESRVSSSSPSNTSQPTSQQNQNQIRPQHASECRDHSSSSSNSNTPPSSRRQTKSESSHSQRHSQNQNQKHQPNQRPPGGSGSTATSSADASATSSQRTPRKNSQNYKSQPSHSQQNFHQRPAQGQKPQKQRSQPPQPQTHISNPNIASTSSSSSSLSSNPQQMHSQSTEFSKLPLVPPSTLPVSSSSTEGSSCTSAGDSSSDTALQEAQTSNPYPISTGLSRSTNMLELVRQTSQNGEEQTFNNVSSSTNGSIPPPPPSASSSVHNEAPSSLQRSSLLPNAMQMRQTNQQLVNGLSSSTVGLPPYQLPMCSYSTLQQIMFDYQRQQIQQETHQQQFQQLMNSFDSQCNSTTSFQSEQGNQSEASVNMGDDRRLQMLMAQSTSKWPVPDSIIEPTPPISSLADVAVSANDDAANLDFDPVKESQQALASLIEHERNNCAINSIPNYLSNSNPHNPGMAPPPGFEMQPPFQASNRHTGMRPPSLNLCHPRMMGFGYYPSGMPPGAFDMGLSNESSVNRSDKGNSMNMSGTPTTDHSQHISAVNSTSGPSNLAASSSPGLPFNVKALQDTLRCVLPEETKITFDPSLMREMQYPSMHSHTTQSNTGTATQFSLDAISSSNNPPGLSQSLDAMANTPTKDSRQYEYCSLWPTTPSRKDGTESNDLCMRNDTVWSSPLTPPGFDSSVLSFLGGMGNNSVHRVGIEGQRSTIGVDAQASVTATGDQQQVINKL